MDAQFVTRQKEAQTVVALNSARATYSFNTAISWQRSSQRTRLRQFAWQELCRARAQRFLGIHGKLHVLDPRHLLEDFPDTGDGRNPEAFSTAPSRDFGRSSLCSESHELVRTPAQTTIFHAYKIWPPWRESTHVNADCRGHDFDPGNRSKCQDVEIQSEQRILRIRKHHPSEDRISPFTQVRDSWELTQKPRNFRF